ncbi:MAG: hypothetical protein EOO01_19000 [Chitinophagaceae bacterium]|nr:MAG: hypothetical protein EOO01_19000 [Chitinophagaceae bacterium]
MRIVKIIVLLFLFSSCDNGATDKDRQASSDSSGSTVGGTAKPDPASFPLERSNPKTDAIATYSRKIENPLNDWYFKVQLFETPQTFKFLMKMQYEEMNEKDTLKIPNLGYEPKLEIRKGEENYSCIIGFIDNKNQFREYKKVLAKNNTLKVTTLKHYGVYYKDK